MALVTMQFPIDQARGKFGGNNGSVLYPLGSRMISRDFVIPNFAPSDLRNAWLSYTSAASAAFSLISDAERAAWQALADQFDRSDAFSQSYAVTAQQAYVSVNTYRIANGQATTDTAPAFSNPLAPEISQLDLDTASGNVQISFATAFVQDSICLCRFSNALPSIQRNARRNDIAVKTSTFAASMVSVSAAANTVTVPGTIFVGAGAEFEVGVEVAFLSTAYVIGQRSFVGNIHMNIP